eukprot:1277738-Rhodomonas_salina.3
MVSQAHRQSSRTDNTAKQSKVNQIKLSSGLQGASMHGSAAFMSVNAWFCRFHAHMGHTNPPSEGSGPPFLERCISSFMCALKLLLLR